MRAVVSGRAAAAMEAFGPLQDTLSYASSEISRVSGYTAFRAGRQMLEEGGSQAELVLLAKRMAVDAVAADEALAHGVETLVGLYEEAARLCSETGAPNGGESKVDVGQLGALAAQYRQRGEVFRQIRDMIASGRPPAPNMSAEEWHAARVVLPVKSAKAALGLGPPVQDTLRLADDDRVKGTAGRQVLRSVLCMDPEDDCSIRKFHRGAGASAPAPPAAAKEVVEASPSERIWPMEDDEWDYLFFPQIFHRGTGDEKADIPRYPSLYDKATALPAAEAPDEEPLVTQRLEGVTLAQVVSALKATGDGSVLERFFGEFTRRSDFKCTGWREEARIPGTEVCGMRYSRPLPTDVPGVVRQLVAIPEATSVTTVLRIRATDDEAVMLLQSLAHDAPLGETFRTQEVIRFHPQDGGVLMTKWAAVVWVKALAWHMAAVGKVIEATSIEGMRESTDKFVDLLATAATAKTAI